jgi:hypothetical protein
MKQQLPEFAVTNWEGVEIRIVLSHPKLEQTVSYMSVLDARMMEDIHYLNPPKDIEFLRSPENIFIYHSWKEKNDRAHKLIDLISNRIAHNLLQFLSEEIEKNGIR